MFCFEFINCLRQQPAMRATLSLKTFAPDQWPDRLSLNIPPVKGKQSRNSRKIDYLCGNKSIVDLLLFWKNYNITYSSPSYFTVGGERRGSRELFEKQASSSHFLRAAMSWLKPGHITSRRRISLFICCSSKTGLPPAQIRCNFQNLWIICVSFHSFHGQNKLL